MTKRAEGSGSALHKNRWEPASEYSRDTYDAFYNYRYHNHFPSETIA
jgi:hypothetical protein